MVCTKKTDVKFTFPVGFQAFHKTRLYNFQLNRWYSFGYARYEDMISAGKKIKSFADWKTEMLKLAKQAETEKRLVNACYYYRAAEFYIPHEDPDKIKSYNKFITLFEKIMKNEKIEKYEIPYKNNYLPCLRIRARDEVNKKVIVMHGGFDSFMEEFYSTMKYFHSHNFEVIVFDGPGQGTARRKFDLAFDYRWEKPVTAVLDYFHLDDVTLLGISMGGYLCFRAAAFEPRIKRLIASSVAYDYMEFPAKILQPVVQLFYKKLRNFTNNASLKQIKKGGMQSWYMSNLMYMTNKEKPIDAIDVISSLTADKLHCERITQDVLILTGRNDHFVPFKMHKKQVQALVNAKSVTDKIFYKDSHAHNHCQIGNMELAFKTMIEWINDYS